MADWPQELVAALERAVEAGLSSSQVAKEIGRSRSAVAGKAWRLGLAFASNPKPDRWRVYQRRAAHG
jgi:hypothetical protein